MIDLSRVKPGSVIEVVYLGTPDCPWCRQWEASARGELLSSPEAKFFQYHEVIGRTLRQPITEEHYPEAIRWLARELGPSRGVPRFLLVSDRAILLSVYGANAWTGTFLPVLREAIQRRNAGT